MLVPVSPALINVSVRGFCKQICMGGREKVETALQKTSAEVGLKEKKRKTTKTISFPRTRALQHVEMTQTPVMCSAINLYTCC